MGTRAQRWVIMTRNIRIHIRRDDCRLMTCVSVVGVYRLPISAMNSPAARLRLSSPPVHQIAHPRAPRHYAVAAYASCPMVNSTCVTPSTPGAYDAPVHVSIGNAGQGISPINNATHPE